VIARRLENLFQLALARKFDVLADEIFSRAVPARNPICYWDKFLILELSPDNARKTRAIDPPDLAGPAELEQLCAQVPDKADLFRRRVREGQECYVYREGNRIVARQWVVRDRPVFETNAGWRFEVPLHPSVWVHDLFIDPEQRLRGYFVGFMQNALRPREAKAPHVYAEIHFRNQSSINSCLRFGFRVVRTVRLGTCLGLWMYAARDPQGQQQLSQRFALGAPAGV
jgi:hypothetical protein